MLSADEILDLIVKGYEEILKERLVGIYVHGSLAMNCFNPNISDIDFLVVISEQISRKEKRALVDLLLELSKVGPGKGIEMSILLESEVTNIKHPTPFVLHYSEAHREKYLNDSDYMCEDNLDYDLAAHITVTIARGYSIYGKPIKEVFGEVPKEYYLESIIKDAEDAYEGIFEQPVYYILNLSRVLLYLKEGIVASKKEGGTWIFTKLPKKYAELVKAAMLAYEAGVKLDCDINILREFACLMLGEIKIYSNS